MRVHTNGFKTNIGSFGRIINTRIYHYLNYNLVSEDEDTIITEDNINLISEQISNNNKELLNNSMCYSMNIVKNGQLLQSLMKEFDFESEYNLKVGEVLNPQLGVLVNNAFEYLNYGNYIIYSKEFNEESQRWNYVCYDKMLYSMIPYKPVNVTYPCTIRDYINAIANRIGLTFANASDTFTNYNQLIAKELFENQGLTYRDVLDKLSEITASNILINDNDQLQIGYPNETNDTISEVNLKDININFAEKFGEITKVAIADTDGNYQYVKGTNGTQITITDNILAFNGDTDTICQNILNKLSGLYYYICDFKTTGVCYYDYLDLFNVSANGNNYQCLLLNNETNIKDGIDETIYNEKFKGSETETNSYTTSVMTNKQVQFKINQQEGKIESKVSKDEMNSAIEQTANEINSVVSQKVGNNEIISKINQSAEEIQIQANKIKLEGYTTINDAFSIDLNGNMSCQDANINGDLVTANGVLTNLQFLCETWGWTYKNVYDKQGGGFIGFNFNYTLSSVQKSFLNFTVRIPEHFTIKSAKIYLRHSPVVWYSPDGTSTKAGSCKNVRAYITSNLGSAGSGAYASEYYIGGNNPTFALINSVSSHNFSDSAFEEYTTENFKDIFTNSGTYNISVMTSNSTPSVPSIDNAYNQLGQYTGILTGFLEIIGYTSNI